MSQQKRRPVFQSSEEVDPVITDPPLKLPEENINDLIGDDAPEPVEIPPVLEQKELKGWKVIGPEQQNGKHYLLTNDINDQSPQQGFWKRTRKMNHFRWVSHGCWHNSLTHKDLIPQPIYFKEFIRD